MEMCDALSNDQYGIAMNRIQTSSVAGCLLMISTIFVLADQQVIYAPSAMPRVDMHTHMDAKTQYELGDSKCDRLPPDVTVNKLTLVSGQPADLTGTLGSLAKTLTVEIAGKVYQGVDNLNGTWKLPGDKFASLSTGTYDVKVTATNSIGLVRTDATTNELTVAVPSPSQRKPKP